MQTQIVEVLINVTQGEDSKIHDGKPKFSGEYVMRALNAAGAVLHEARLTVRDLDVPTSDYARHRCEQAQPRHEFRYRHLHRL